MVQAEHCPSCDELMRAIVQHNRRSILENAVVTPAPAQQSQQQQQLLNVQGRENKQQEGWQQQQQPQRSEPPAVLVVGYVMKASREEQLASAGLLNLLPIDGICFMPFDVGQLGDAAQRQGHIDILLHKGSDELVTGPDGGVVWSQRLLELQAWLAAQPNICVVDPFVNTAKVRLLPASLWPQRLRACRVCCFTRLCISLFLSLCVCVLGLPTAVSTHMAWWLCGMLAIG